MFQILVGRLQKERDEAKSECKDLHDRIELQQTQFQKTQREKEILHTELEVYKERLDKLQSSVQKIHVNINRSPPMIIPSGEIKPLIYVFICILRFRLKETTRKKN